MTGDQISSEVRGNEEFGDTRNRWRAQHLFSRRDFDQRVKLGQHCLFIFVNFLQQLALVSSAELISFPEEWLLFFSWLSSFALLDFLSLFDVSSDLALTFKIVVTTLMPVAIVGIISVVALEREFADDERRYCDWWRKCYCERDYDDDDDDCELRFCRCCRATCAVLFGALAVAFLVIGTLDSVEVGFTVQQVFVFVGVLCALCVTYALLRALIVWRINRLREKMGESAYDIFEVQIESEVYVCLFIFVSIYASVFKSALSFITLLSSSTSNAVIQISGIVLSFLSALFILAYTWWRARKSRDGDDEYGKFLTVLFEDRFWYFQVVIMLDKTVILLIRLFDNDVLATSLALTYLFVFTLFIIVAQPYDRTAVLGAGSTFGSRYLSAKNIDIFGRTANFVLLLFVLVFNLAEADTREVLGPVTILVSILTGLLWLYILLVALGFHRVVLYKLALWRFKAIWVGKDEMQVKELVQNRNELFPPEEAEALTNAQCLWVVRHSASAQVRSSALLFERDWSRKGVREEDIQNLCESLEFNHTFASLK